MTRSLAPRFQMSGTLVVVFLAVTLASCTSGGGTRAAHPTTTAAGGQTTTGTRRGAWIGARRVGRQSDGSVVTPSGQLISPAGAQVELLGRPLAVAIRPDGRTAALLSGTSIQAGSAPLLSVVDLATAKVVQQFTPSGSSVASFGGLVYSPDGGYLYASALNAVVEASVASDGSLTFTRKFTVPYPTGLAISPDGSTLYAGLSTKNAVAVVDRASGDVRAADPRRERTTRSFARRRQALCREPGRARRVVRRPHEPVGGHAGRGRLDIGRCERWHRVGGRSRHEQCFHGGGRAPAHGSRRAEWLRVCGQHQQRFGVGD